MEYEFKTSFDRSLKQMPLFQKEQIKSAVNHLIDYFETGQRPAGLGLKRLHGVCWEIRVNIRDRILFSRIKNRVVFLIAGDHDEINRRNMGSLMQ